MSRKSYGFTIVELLVVIVVIGILATITIVSYTGISQRAVVASLQSDLSNSANILKLYQLEHSAYPTSIGSNYCPTPSDTKYCLKTSSGNAFDYTNYTVNNSTNPQTFKLDITNGSTKYRITDNTPPTIVAAIVLPPNTTDNGNGTYTTKIYSNSANDGMMWNNICFDEGVQTPDTTGTTMSSGSYMDSDNNCNRDVRAFQKFDISVIPGTVSSANINNYLNWNGDSDGINSMLYHIPDFGALDVNDYDTAPYNLVGVLATQASGVGIKILNVTTSVQQDKTANRQYSAYRIQTASEAYNLYSDFDFNATDSPTNKPYLSIIWSP